jgi:hypothetical protein
VRKKVDEGKKVRFVDLRNTLLASDVAADKIHLTHCGNTKLAYRWYGAMVSSPVVRYESELATLCEQWTVTAQTVTLNAGRHAVRFARGTCFAELDSVDLVRNTTTWPPL